MIERSRRLIVCVDSSKWGVVGLSSMAGLSAAAVLVTDSGLPAQASGALSDHVDKLLVVDPIDDELRRARRGLRTKLTASAPKPRRGEPGAGSRRRRDPLGAALGSGPRRPRRRRADRARRGQAAGRRALVVRRPAHHGARPRRHARLCRHPGAGGPPRRWQRHGGDTQPGRLGRQCRATVPSPAPRATRRPAGT